MTIENKVEGVHLTLNGFKQGQVRYRQAFTPFDLTLLNITVVVGIIIVYAYLGAKLWTD